VEFRNERHFQTATADYGIIHDWLVYGHPDSRKANFLSTPGFFDLVLMREIDARIVLMELKMGKRKPNEDQQLWARVARLNPGVEVYLKYPTDWESITWILK